MKPKNTVPEVALRRELRKYGISYRLHRSDLPGTPDIVIGRERLAIFVHGCYWHRHYECSGRKYPKSSSLDWVERFNRQVVRDQHNLKKLQKMGWETLVIWECQLRQNPAEQARRIESVLAQLRSKRS